MEDKRLLWDLKPIDVKLSTDRIGLFEIDGLYSKVIDSKLRIFTDMD